MKKLVFMKPVQMMMPHKFMQDYRTRYFLHESIRIPSSTVLNVTLYTSLCALYHP